MEDEPRQVSFIASLPSIQSAISVSGDGTGARLKLDIPASDADAIPLIQIFFSGKAFRVTLELLDEDDRQRQRRKRTTRNRD